VKAQYGYACRKMCAELIVAIHISKEIELEWDKVCEGIADVRIMTSSIPYQ